MLSTPIGLAPLLGEPPPRVSLVLRFFPCFSTFEPSLEVPRVLRLVPSLHSPRGEGADGVQEFHIGAHRLLGDCSGGLRLALLLVSQLLGHLPGVLRLGAEVAYYSVEELLSQLSV